MQLEVVLLVSLITLTKSADILLISSVASISHSLWHGKLALLLANNGHQISVLDTDPIMFKHPNITHVVMKGGYGWLKEMEDLVKESPDALDTLVDANSVFETTMLMADPAISGCDLLIKSEPTQTFMRENKGRKFDLVIADGLCDCFYGMVSVFGNPPLIPTCPYLAILPSDAMGLFDNPSYVPHHLSTLPSRMTLYERLTNTIYHLFSIYAIEYHSIPNNDKLMREAIGPSVAKMADILRDNVPFVMTGWNHLTQGAKPLPPSYITISGFHVDPPKPLPQNIKTFLDGAKDGAILFSMGSNFKSILMSPEKRDMFLSVFKNIPQRIIWKLELDNSTGIPPNVMITKWLPQNDILAHPNVRAFICQGGLLGTQEAIHRGVPVLGLPLMYDQVNNMYQLERLGVGIRLYYKKLNRNYIAKQIDLILNNPSYMYNMKKFSAAFKDRPMTPQQTALFWIEYSLRHANHKHYLKPESTQLKLYQRLLLDVVAFVSMVLLVLYLIIRAALRCITGLVCGKWKKSHSVSMDKKKL